MLREEFSSPFGGACRHVRTMDVAELRQRYLAKCGVDVGVAFGSLREVRLFECMQTGYRFWRPSSVTADVDLYRRFSEAWPNYYREHRWEYPFAQQLIVPGTRLLEVGCGAGNFLARVSGLCSKAIGLEPSLVVRPESFQFLRSLSLDIRPLTVQDLDSSFDQYFDVIACFQVLEHLVEPLGFLNACLQRLRKGGLLLVSTPNHDCPENRSMNDVFDLPPHHMGHFSGLVFEKLASVLSVDLIKLKVQPHPNRLVENGPNLLVVLKKKDIKFYPAGRAHYFSNVERNSDSARKFLMLEKGFELDVIMPERPLWVWGGGVTGQKTAELLASCGRWVSAFVDQNPALTGKEIDGIPVRCCQELREEMPRPYVVIGSQDRVFVDEIRGQLDSLGYVFLDDYQLNPLPKKNERGEQRLRRFTADMYDVGVPTRGQRILDYGCGDGAFVSAALEWGWDAWGVDVSRQKQKLWGRHNLHISTPERCLIYDGEILPFETNHFDYVYSWFVFEHVQQTALACREIARVLKPGGVAAIYAEDAESGYEGHVKIPFPPYFPKRFIRAYLSVFGKAEMTDYLVNYVFPCASDNVAEIFACLGCEVLESSRPYCDPEFAKRALAVNDNDAALALGIWAKELESVLVSTPQTLKIVIRKCA